MKDQLDALLRHITTAQSVFDSEASWESKYDLIFAHHKQNIRPLVDALGLDFDYYDPDTSYEEDVRAYITALAELRDEVVRVLAGFGGDKDEIQLVVTANAIMHKGVWDEFCQMRGLNPWAMNEGRMDSSERFTLSSSEAKQLGFLARD